MTLAQCSIELLNPEVSDTTKVHSSNGVKYIIIQLYFKELFKKTLQNKSQPGTDEYKQPPTKELFKTSKTA